MLLKDFYRNVVTSERTCLRYLRENNLLPEEGDAAPCHRCGADMQEKRKRDRGGEFRPVLRCTQRGCQTTRSVRQGNTFFHYTDLNNRVNSNLTLCGILELVLMFTQEIPLNLTVQLTGKSTATVNDWFNMCREVCSGMLRRRPQLLGTASEPIQIDEARFAGRRKYNRGRMLQGDSPAEDRDNHVVIANQRNHGNRIDGPWVFGLKKGTDLRYFYVERRDRDTLLPIIQRECAPESVIHSDEWPAYTTLRNHGFIHHTVNHQESYVNPANGVHTQGIERSWLDAKVKLLKKMRGVPIASFQSHLDHYCWKVANKNEDLFLAFLRDIRNMYV